MGKSQELRKAAADQASAAAEYGQKALKDGWSKAEVLLDDGLDRAQDLWTKAQKEAGPAFKKAKVRTADFASRRFDQVEPHIRGALDKVQPAVESARLKLSEDVLPGIASALHNAAERPQQLAEAIAPPKKKSGWKTFGKVVALAAIVAGAVAAVRHFLAPKDDGWTAHEPSRAYVDNNDTFATAAKVATETPASGSPEQEAADKDSEAAEDVEPGKYGEGAHVGPNPPEGFIIKGNERSMKYHVPGTGGYERTIAEVWFRSEEDAEKAGFTKAQR